MSSLIGSSRTTENASMRARTTAAIQRTAGERAAVGGAAERLAADALSDPAPLVGRFLPHIAVNPAVADAACADCGHSAVDDGAILYIVDQQWEAIAESIYPTTS